MKHLLFCLLIASTPFCRAASFNCKLAKTNVEKAICADPALSALDEKLAMAYKRALIRAGEGDIALKLEQRQYIADMTNGCGENRIATCIRESYTARIEQLDAVQPPDPASITEYRLNQASKFFDFVVRVQANLRKDPEEYPETPGRVLVFRKGEVEPFQTIAMDNIAVSLGDDGQPLFNASTLYWDQGLINVGDFNFDGHEDFAVQNGNHGPYGQQTYSVYLFAPAQSRFQLSEPMSRLIENTLGFFHIDSRHKQLITLSKSGCCYHTTVMYKVINDRPIPVSRIIDDERSNDGFLLVSHERKINGRWLGTQERIPKPAGGKER